MTASPNRPPRSRKNSTEKPASLTANPIWPPETELVSIVLHVQPQKDYTLYPQYPIGLHAWFLDQVRQSNPELATQLHDDQTEKPFTLSGLFNPKNPFDRPLTLQRDRPYHWTITALSQPLTQWLASWLKQPPSIVELRNAPLTLCDWAIANPPTTYQQLFANAEQQLQRYERSPTAEPLAELPLPTPSAFNLSFVSPTSFRHRKHHLPLPIPENVFHSYLRRWNLFSEIEFDADDYLDWIDEMVVIARHQITSQKVAAGKRGSVTGFTGAVQFSLVSAAYTEPEFIQLFLALGGLAPYCGTGHKTTFGLGQTRLGWQNQLATPAAPSLQDVLSQRISELTDRFITQRKRLGGDRAIQIAETWATILARRELGDSLQAIAEDLQMPYETVKTYAKKARKAASEE